MVGELLGRPSGISAAPHLEAARLQADGLVVHHFFRDPGPSGQGDRDLVKVRLIGLGVKDRQAEPVYQGKLFLHGIGAVDVLAVLHIVPAPA